MSLQQTPEQLSASDPKSSVWVGASAGTGKTFVLSNRVLRLMLAGSRPDKILCLTYTKNAAAEMAIRVNKRLSSWVSMTDKALHDELRSVLGQAPHKDQIKEARKLFAKVLDVPGGLKIQTIHSFCQSLLGRFPIEASVSPNFELLDDITIHEQLRHSMDEMLIDIDGGSDEKLQSALNHISGMLAEDTFNSLMTNLMLQRGDLEKLLEQNSFSFNRVSGSLKTMLGFDKGEDRETIIAAACDQSNFDFEGLKIAASHLLNGTKTDIDKGEKINAWLNSPETREDNFDTYKRAFLTTKDEFFAKYMTKKLAEEYPGSVETLYKEAQRVKFVSERLKAYSLFENTNAILRLGTSLIKIYNSRKRNRNVVDYDDLIGKITKLFKTVSASWILFKLDEGIDHILIDEAQDTNPDQWEIIVKLALEFFAGIGTRDEEQSADNPRTIFAVGDVKQSIYSFQKAEPKAFNITRDYFEKQVIAADQKFQNVPMNLSFRSTAAVLEVVDQVFKSDEDRHAISFSHDEIIHDTHRKEEPGLIEVWDTIIPEEAEPEEDWSPPVLQRPSKDAKQKLAERIADKIDSWLRNGEILESQSRPITPGDILILVQKRKDFVHYMIRALKNRRINVAGLDQMLLTDQLAVMDLMAVANFTLLPSDNLTLAVVLKSPFIGMDEDDLFELAYHRKKGQILWSALLKKRSEKNVYEKAASFLTDLTNYADFSPPFEFFTYLLGPKKGREKLIQRLGEQCNDPVDEFLNMAMKYEQNNISSMQGFLSWIEKSELKIKREMEQGGDMVRIMTVHGAKGLEAPIVFLPDTCQGGDIKDNIFWHEQGRERQLLWVKNADTRVGAGKVAYEARKSELEAENKRLLYVAMTRAEDRLYVTGFENDHHTNRKPGNWYDMVKTAVTQMEGMEEVKDGDEIVLRRKRYKSSTSVIPAQKSEIDLKLPDLPKWAGDNPTPEPVPSRPLSPSRPDDEEISISPLEAARHLRKDKQKYHRGRTIHKLLELLPDLPTSERESAARQYLSQPVHELGDDDIEKITSDILSILTNPDYLELFGEKSRAEVPIVGQVGHYTLSGQVDRLSVLDGEILVVDYKTNRPPPSDTKHIPHLYQKQMAGYRAVLQDIYPDHRVRTFLLWTDIGHLMEIPDQQLDKIVF